MELNPYAKNLGDANAWDVIKATAQRVAELAARLPKEQTGARSPGGKWNGREIIAHLADCELVFGFRMRQTLAEDHPTVQPFDQDRWAARYDNCDLESALNMFVAARRWNLLLLAGVDSAERQRLVSHPERGTMTLANIVETMAGHDLNHLSQLERLAKV